LTACRRYNIVIETTAALAARECNNGGMMKKNINFAVLYAVLAAVLYALSAPVSKLLIINVPAKMLAAFLYLGAGIGLGAFELIHKFTGRKSAEKPLEKRDLPYIAGMVALDIAAPIFLMTGLSMTTAANTSLLNNFEIVATSVIAMFIFREKISKRLWAAISLVTLACIILSFENITSLRFSWGSLFVLLACVAWGFENNCTRMLSDKNPQQIVVIKGIFSGSGALAAAVLSGDSFPELIYVSAALILGFFAYGLSIFFYIHAQRHLGAAKTSAYYAVAPFIGVAFSFVFFKQVPTPFFFVALAIMAAGTYFISTDGRSG
jgi:drug/metabolite transporter (DMT)-like permease